MPTRTHKGGIPRLVMGRDDAPDPQPLARPQRFSTFSAVIGHVEKVETDHLATDIARHSREVAVTSAPAVPVVRTEEDRALGVARERYVVGGKVYYRTVRTLDLGDDEPLPCPAVQAIRRRVLVDDYRY